MSDVRRGTRIACQIPLTLESLDPARPFLTQCTVIVANPQGCGIRLNRGLDIDSRVQLIGLPEKKNVIAQVISCILIAEYEKLWFAGLALDEPGNVWGIENPPGDWMSTMKGNED